MTTFESIPLDIKCLMVSYMDLAVGCQIYSQFVLAFEISPTEFKRRCIGLADIEDSEGDYSCRICYYAFPGGSCLHCIAIAFYGYPEIYNQHRLNDYKILNEFDEYCRAFRIGSENEIPSYDIFQEQCMGYYESFDHFLNENDEVYADMDTMYKKVLDLDILWSDYFSLDFYRSCEGEEDSGYGYGYYFCKN